MNQNKIFLLLIALLITVITGCVELNHKQNTKKNNDESYAIKDLKQLENKTMKIHDSIMPQMDSLMRLKQRLKERLEGIQKENSKKMIKQRIDSLKEARRNMMDWMSRYTKGYKRLPDTASKALKSRKLDSLHNDIKELKKQWDQTLSSSSELLMNENN